MSNRSLVADTPDNAPKLSFRRLWNRPHSTEIKAHHTKAALITKAASSQTYYTIRFLVDRERVADAYRAYAYFRWVDDWVDEGDLDQNERRAFIHRQQDLIERAYRGEWPSKVTDEEQFLVDLIRTDPDPTSGLHAYITNMMSVMAFDAERRGRLISEAELDTYTHQLAVGVTEALYYFIGHNNPSPHTPDRYLPVIAAHITHMLRDMIDDYTTDYINIPRDYLEKHGIQPNEFDDDAYYTWIRCRVRLARDLFMAGESYLSRVKNWRCRLAGYAYVARFKAVLDTIERDGYQLRPDYNERKTLWGRLKLMVYVLGRMLSPQGFSQRRLVEG